jgi:hypothetical protein
METKTSKHTPGPWNVNGMHDNGTPEVWVYDDKADQLVARVICETKRHEANARLIAAAPDLLEACKAALSLAWEVGCETEDGVGTLLEDSRGDLFRQLSAALAKAVQS